MIGFEPNYIKCHSVIYLKGFSRLLYKEKMCFLPFKVLKIFYYVLLICLALSQMPLIKFTFKILSKYFR